MIPAGLMFKKLLRIKAPRWTNGTSGMTLWFCAGDMRVRRLVRWPAKLTVLSTERSDIGEWAHSKLLLRELRGAAVTHIPNRYRRR